MCSSLEEAVKQIVSNALTSLPPEKVSAITDLIMKECPEEIEDLKHLELEDLAPELTKLQSRKLLSFIKEKVLKSKF